MEARNPLDSRFPAVQPVPFGRPSEVPAPVSERFHEDGPRPTFAEHAVRPTYSFPGLHPFVDAEAVESEYQDHHLRHRVKADWFFVQCSNALGNACHQKDKAAAKASIDHAMTMCAALSLAVRAMEAGIAETIQQLGIEYEPPF